MTLCDAALTLAIVLALSFAATAWAMDREDWGNLLR